VIRFDGQKARDFLLEDLAPRQAMQYVSALVEDRSGQIWVATNSGAIRVSSGADSVAVFTTGNTNGGLAGDDIRALTVAIDGHVWFGTSGGLSEWNPGSSSWQIFTATGTNGALPGDQVTGLATDDHGPLWIATTSGAASLDLSTRIWTTLTRQSTAGGLPNDKVFAVAPDREGHVWFATDGGTVRYSPQPGGLGAWRLFPASSDSGPATDYANAIIADAHGNVWVGTGQGLSRYESGSLRWTTYDQGSSEGALGRWTVGCLAVGSTNRLWVGGLNPGVAMYDGSDWIGHRQSDAAGPVHDWINTMAVDPDGVLWLGTVGGVTRYDGRGWASLTSSSTGGGLADNNVYAVLPLGLGRRTLFGTSRGLSVFDTADSSWMTYTSSTTDGQLPYDKVAGIIRDSTGAIWACTIAGLGRWDQISNQWLAFTPASTSGGLVSEYVYGGLCARSGTLWFCTRDGISSYDPRTGSWRAFTTESTAGGLEGGQVFTALEDSIGNIWFGTSAGASRYDPASHGWASFGSIQTGAGGVKALASDHQKRIWFGTDGGGASYFDGTRWVPYGTGARLTDLRVNAIACDSTGSLWFGTSGGLTEHHLDVVPPVTVFSTSHRDVTPARDITVAYGAGYGEGGIEFSHRTDGAAWSEWTTATSWTEPGLTDGVHRFYVRARDEAGNIETPGVSDSTEVDATPPLPQITFPASGQFVRDTVRIVGTTEDSRFKYFRLMGRPAGSTSQVVRDTTTTPVVAGELAVVDTRSLPDGPCAFVLSVTDALGLTGNAQVTVTVDNQFPPAQLTSPALVNALSGGDVYSADGLLHLEFPPRGFDHDVLVRVDPESSATSAGPSSGRRILHGYRIDWGTAVLSKPCIVTAAQPAESLGVGETLHLYRLAAGGDLVLIAEAERRNPATITSWLTEGGTYVLAAESPGSLQRGRLGSVLATPRVGVYRQGWTGFAVGFELTSPDRVTATIYNRAGRRVSRLLDHADRPAGRNTVRWNGVDDDGQVAGDGLYMVIIETSAQRAQTAIALVR